MTQKHISKDDNISNKTKDNSIDNFEFKTDYYGIFPAYSYEIKEGILYREGFIATTHLDKGFYDPVRGKYVRDTIQKETLDTIAERINDPNKYAPKVTYRHKQEKECAGTAVKGTAKVVNLGFNKESGKIEYGLWCKSRVNEAYYDYEKVKKEIENGVLDGFSIEYATKYQNGNDIPGSVMYEDKGDYIQRTLTPNIYFKGWTYAAEPMNDYTVAAKELYSLNRSSDSDGLEEKNMSKEKTDTPDISEAELKELQELKEYKKKIEEEKKAKDAAEKKKAEDDKRKAEEEEKKKQEAESKESFKKEVLAEILESKEFSEALDKKAEKPKMEGKEIAVEVKELKTVFENKEASPSRQVLAATKYALSKVGELKEMNYKVDGFKGTDAQSHVIADGTKMSVEFKSLGLADNLSPASSSALEGGHQHADLREALDAAIVNLLNDNVSYYDFVKKVNKSGSGSDRALFIVRNGRNPTAGAYTGNSVSTGQSSRRKFGTAFKKYQVGVAVDGDMIAANKGAQHDVLSTEIEAATLDLKKEINTDSYTEQGLETDAKIIGLEFVADGAGNSTMYGETRSAANGLLDGTAAHTYASGASGDLKSNIRTMIRHILVDGGNAGSVKIFMSPLQYQRLVEAEENALRYATDANSIGIGGPLKLDGKYDIIMDVDCPDAKVFIVDMSTVEMQFWVTPTFEPLGKRSDSEEGFIKTYLAHCFKAPRRVTMLHSVPTTV